MPTPDPYDPYAEDEAYLESLKPSDDPFVARQFQGSPLERFAGLRSVQFPQPTSFGQGFVQGLVGQVGAAGSRIASAREKFEDAEVARQAAFDKDRLEASRRYREESGKVRRDRINTERLTKKEREKFEAENPVLTAEQKKVAPWLTRIADKEGRVPRNALVQAMQPKDPKSAGAFDRADFSALNTAIRSDPAIKRFQDIQFGHTIIKSGAGLNTPQGDMAVIFGYMKMLDPGSTVREGEYANAQNSAGIPERVRQQWNQLLRGDKLSTEQRKGFESAAEELLRSTRTASDQSTKRFRKAAQSLGVPEDLLFSPEEVAPPPPPGAAAGSAPAPRSTTPYRPGGFFDRNRPGGP